jgi:hypothetical protein
MLVSKTELEEMLGYSLEELDISLKFEKGEYDDNSFRKVELSKETLTLLFERVREQTWCNAQQQFSEWDY